MSEQNKNTVPAANLQIQSRDDAQQVVLAGAWTLTGLERAPGRIRRELAALDESAAPLHWDLSAIESLDSAGALLLSDAWGGRLPSQLEIDDEHRSLLERVMAHKPGDARPPAARWTDMVMALDERLRGGFEHAQQCTVLFGQLIVDLVRVFMRPAHIPWRELSANIHKIGTRALGVTALVGFLIGVVISYLLALQLRLYGAGDLIVNFVGLSVVRELGPVLAAILIAGRSGSAITAELGVMRVTEELDALKTLGISVSQRLLLPRVLAMAVALPLVVLWTSAIGITGGMVSARIELGIGFDEFLMLLPQAVPVGSFWIGISKGLVFGVLIAVIACHFGLRVKPDTESLGRETTNAVVVSITMVILANAVFAVLLREVGF